MLLFIEIWINAGVAFLGYRLLVGYYRLYG
jgi:hypothetical protein